MAIHFSCGQCGKDYAVSDGLAGKKAACKACGNRMIIPGTPVAVEPSPPPPPRPVATSPASPARPAERPASAAPREVPASAGPKVSMRFADAGAATANPRPRPRSVDDSPAGDVYGFDEAPSALPSLPPRLGAAGVQDEADAAPVKKKKKKGFFSSGPKKSPSGSGFGLGGLSLWQIRIGIAVIIGIVGAIGKFGLAGKSEVKAFHSTLISLRGELLTSLQGVKDVPTAQSSSARARKSLERLADHLEKNGFKKGRKEDIAEANQEFTFQHMMQSQQIIQELTRVAAIPGAMQALNIEAPAKRLEVVEEKLKREAEKEN